MKKFIALKLINFGIWIYDVCGEWQVWEKEDFDNYRRLKEKKSALESV